MRKEVKYVIDYSEYKQIQQVLEICMKKDINANKKGTYNIKTIYFDNYFQEIQKNKKNDINSVDKYRIRMYDNKETSIYLEKKTNENGYIKKIKEQINKNDVINILDGRYNEILEENPSLKTEMYLNIILKMLRPALLIEYERMAFADDLSGVRITIDKEIKSTIDCNSFFKTIEGTSNNKYILEVKYNKYLPDYIKNIVINIKRKRRGKSKFISEMEKHKNFGGI